MNLPLLLRPDRGRRFNVFLGPFMIGHVLTFDGSDLHRLFYTANFSDGVGPLSRDFADRDALLNWIQGGAPL